MSSAVAFLMIAVVLSVLGGTVLWYINNRGARASDLPPIRRAPPVDRGQEPRSGIRVIGVDDERRE